MDKSEATKINNLNKKFVKELNEKLPDCNARYSYHYEKGGYVHGYDGEPGFDLKDTRTATLKIYDQAIRIEDSNYRNSFDVLGPKDVKRFFSQQIKECELSQRDSNNQKSIYADEYIKRKKEFQSNLEKITQAFPQPITKEEAIKDFSKDKKGKLSLDDSEFSHLTNDMDVVKVAIKSAHRNYRYASEDIQNDKKLAIEMLTEEPWSLHLISDKLKNDKEIVLLAIEKDLGAARFASEEIQKLFQHGDEVNSLKKAILHEQLQKEIKPKGLDFAKSLSAECKQAAMEQSSQVAKARPKMKI